MNRVLTTLDRATDHIGDALFVVYALVALGSVAVAILVAIAVGSWWALLVALCFPAFWLYMWWSD